MPKRSKKQKISDKILKCGEIFYQNESFTIVCLDCDEKHLDFQTFLCHFREIHCEHGDNEIPGFEYDNESSYIENSPIFSTKGEDLSNEGNENFMGFDKDFEKISKPSVEKEKEKNPSRLRRVHACEHCKNKYVSVQGLKKHLKQKHPESQELNCSPNEKTLNETQVDLDVLFSCLICQKVFKNRSNLQKHSETHIDNQNLPCNFKGCGKNFKSRRRLREHIRWHTAKKNYVCEVCGYRTLLKYTLEAHIRTHTGEKPYACNTCGKHFISMSMVKEHAATHTSDRRHKCNVCGATFTRAKALYHHMPLHLGIKKFCCSICDKRYTQAAGLSAHMRKHKIDGKIKLI